MKKILRFLLAFLGIIVLGIVVLGIVEPQDITVTRSTVIAAPKDVIWDQVAIFRNWPNWSPWYAMDTAAKMTYSGEDGKVGSGYHWIGTKTETGEGDMKSTGMKDGELDWALNFQKPMKGEANGFFKLTDTAGSNVKVTWSFSSHHSFPMNAMHAFINMDKMLGGDFEKGLSSMKKYCETKAAMPKVDIKEIQFAAHSYAGIRKTVGTNFADQTKFNMENMPAMGKEVAAKMIGAPCDLFWSWDTVSHTSEMAVAAPVSDTSKPIKGISYFYVPASKACMTTYVGPYSGLGSAHMALMKYMAGKGYQHGVGIEEYIIDPGKEKDSTKWATNVYYIIK